MRPPSRAHFTLILLCALLFSANTQTKTVDPSSDVKLDLPGTAKRYNLILAPAGDTSKHESWLASSVSSGRNWDLALVYYGDKDAPKCKQCVTVLKQNCAKWRCVSYFLNSTEWINKLSHHYETVMVADDDLVMDAAILNRYFKIFRDFRLTIAQPSLCPGSYSFWGWVVSKRVTSLMRYTNFVELMAPTFSTPFFDTVVRETVTEAYTGWGLDFIWPFLLKYPRSKVAIVDYACITHLNQQEEGRKRVYFADMPRNAYDELDYTLDKYKYNNETVQKYGIKFWEPMTFGMLSLGAEPQNPPPDPDFIVDPTKPGGILASRILLESEQLMRLIGSFIVAFVLFSLVRRGLLRYHQRVMAKKGRLYSGGEKATVI